MRSTSTELPDMYVVLPTGLQFSLMSCSRYFQVRLVFRLHGRSLWQGRRFVSGLVPLPYEVHQYLATGISALLPIYFHRAGCAFPFYVVCMILIGLNFYMTDVTISLPCLPYLDYPYFFYSNLWCHTDITMTSPPLTSLWPHFYIITPLWPTHDIIYRIL